MKPMETYGNKSNDAPPGKCSSKGLLLKVWGRTPTDRDDDDDDDDDGCSGFLTIFDAGAPSRCNI